MTTPHTTDEYHRLLKTESAASIRNDVHAYLEAAEAQHQLRRHLTPEQIQQVEAYWGAYITRQPWRHLKMSGYAQVLDALDNIPHDQAQGHTITVTITPPTQQPAPRQRGPLATRLHALIDRIKP